MPVHAVCSCRPYTLPDGDSNGQPVVRYEDGVDWGNGFVGQYDLADVQYKNFTAVNNNIGMYWKGSKNMRSTGAAHIKVGLCHIQCMPCTVCRGCAGTQCSGCLSAWLELLHGLRCTLQAAQLHAGCVPHQASPSAYNA